MWDQDKVMRHAGLPTKASQPTLWKGSKKMWTVPYIPLTCLISQKVLMSKT